MKKILLELIAKKAERKAELVKQAKSCEDMTQMRAINIEMDILVEDIKILQDRADKIPDIDPNDPDGRTATVNEAERREQEMRSRGGYIAQPVPAIVQAGARQVRTSTDTEDMEYRKAFMEHVLRGTEIPAELRENTLTSDVGSAIPTVLVNRIIEKMEAIGMILPLVTRTSYAAGVNIPTSTVKPVATWVAEGATSDRQKKTTGVITFTHHKLRCEISMSMEVSVMAISAFEAAFVRQVAEAMVKAIESKIVSADTGATSNSGILASTPAAGQALTVTDELTYGTLISAEAALPQAYESGAVWCMTKKTFMAFAGMVDDVGQPIARTNYGIGGAPERTLLGRTVVLCGDYMPNFSTTLASGTTFAFLFNFSDYILNTIYDMGIQRKQDWDTEDMLTKAVMSVDGKVVDTNSLVTLSIA